MRDQSTRNTPLLCKNNTILKYYIIPCFIFQGWFGLNENVWLQIRDVKSIWWIWLQRVTRKGFMWVLHYRRLKMKAMFFCFIRSTSQYKNKILPATKVWEHNHFTIWEQSHQKFYSKDVLTYFATFLSFGLQSARHYSDAIYLDHFEEYWALTCDECGMWRSRIVEESSRSCWCDAPPCCWRIEPEVIFDQGGEYS